MRNQILTAIFVVFVAGAFSAASAQQTTRIVKAGDTTPSYTYRGHWYGFVTCNRLQRQGPNAKLDDIKKCLASGGTAILANGGRMDVMPQAKVIPFAGQEVWITGTLTSTKYGTGPTSDDSIEGYYAGGDRPATKFEGIQVETIMPTVRDDAISTHYNRADADIGARVSDKAQQ